MGKIPDYPAAPAPVNTALELPVYDPTDPAVPDKRVTIDVLRTADVGTAANPVAATLKQITAANGSATLNSGNSYAGEIDKLAGKVTTDSLSTAAGSSQALAITNSLVGANDLILVTRIGGTSAAGTPIIKAVATSGTITITIDNKHASAAFDGTFVLAFLVIKVLT